MLYVDRCHYFLVCKAFDSQSMAESKPSPFVADVLNIWNVRSFKASRPRAECTSATLIHPSISCLLANTTKTAPPSSSSYSSECMRKNKYISQLFESEWQKGKLKTYPQHIKQFIFGYSYSIPIGGINDINNCICVTVIASPIRSYACLSPKIPNLEF